MKIEKREVETVVKQKITTNIYIAFDGKEFTSSGECKDYEMSERQKKVKHLEVKALQEKIPINDDLYPSESGEFKWYLLKNEEDNRLFEEAFDEGLCIKQFPEYVCTETHEYDYEIYFYTLSKLKEDTKLFFEFFDLGVHFTKK